MMKLLMNKRLNFDKDIKVTFVLKLILEMYDFAGSSENMLAGDGLRTDSIMEKLCERCLRCVFFGAALAPST